ncbi:uncharacterized protein LOC119279312 [Triticum dicoccoides]|uniref:uncharacterized protein LOC119279312 n=1 Tax=Triticum dicoccoides TaxID=85692 RepID=UPI00188E61F3|nr:uncharacterized protein LOC119279312 [Triticum dicoccoides]
MPPCRRETWGYRGIRVCPFGSFSTEIWFRGMRIVLDTFDTAHEATSVYDTTAWHLRWRHRTLNFPNVPTREWAQELAPPPRLITDEDCRDNRRQKHRLGIAEMDVEAMALWRQCFPHDIINEHEFYAQTRADREKRRAERAAHSEDKRMQKSAAQFNMKLGATSPWDSYDNRYLDTYIETSEEDIENRDVTAGVQQLATLLCEHAWSVEFMQQGLAWCGGLLLRLPASGVTHGTDGLGRGGKWGSQLTSLSGHPAGFYVVELVFLLTGRNGECGENGARRIWGAVVWCSSCQASGLI